MATPVKLRRNAKPVFTVKVGAGTAVDYSDDLLAWGLEPDDPDDSAITFAEAASGNSAEWTFTVTALVADNTGAFFKFLWDTPGTDVVVVFGPKQGAASATNPNYTFTMNTGYPPGFSSEAAGSNDTTPVTFEKEFKVTTQITRVVA